MSQDHISPLLADGDAAPFEPTRASPLRWLVLFTFSLVSAQQQMGWVLPGAVSPNFEAVYSMSPDTIQLISEWPASHLSFAVGFLLLRLNLLPPPLFHHS